MSVIVNVLGHQHRWLVGGYDLEIGHFKRWIAWWLAGGWWLFAQCLVPAARITSVKFCYSRQINMWNPYAGLKGNAI